MSRTGPENGSSGIRRICARRTAAKRSSLSTITTAKAGRFSPLPPQFGRKVFVDEIVVEGSQFFEVRFFVALGVEIVGIKSPHPFEHLAVLVIHEMAVLTVTMGGVE